MRRPETLALITGGGFVAAHRHHVVFVVTNYPPRSGGVEAHVAAVAHALACSGTRCSVVCLGDEPGVRDDDGVIVHTLRRRADVGGILAVPGPLAWWATTRAVLADASHVSVHTRFFPMTWLGLRAARRRGIPVLHTEHGADHVRTGSAAVNRVAWLVDRTVGRAALRGATRVLTVSEEVSDFVRSLSGRDSAVVGNGVDVALWRGDTTSSAAARIVFVGRLVDEKGWATFLDVAEKAAREVPGLRAVIAGDGPRRPAVEAAVAASGRADIVSVLGRLAPADVRVLLHGAVLVNPTLAAEGFQLTLPEALAAGARIVSYAVPGVAPMREAGLPVRVVPRGDAAALARAAVEELLAPTPAASVASLMPWDWSRVAARYAAAVEDTDR